MQIELDEKEIAVLLEAMDDAERELCLGKGFPEANAYAKSMHLIAEKFRAVLVAKTGTIAPVVV